MAEIPSRLLDGLSDELAALSESGRQMVANALANAEWETIDELRELAIAAMETVCSVLGEIAAARTAEFYDTVRVQATGEALGAVPSADRESERTAGAVRALVNGVGVTRTMDAFVNLLGERVSYELNEVSGETVKALCRKDPLKPRYARVPCGGGCSFCLMLGSKGFVYRTELTAGEDGHYHAHCRCRVVPGFDGMEVEGYDPDALYDQWRRLEVEEAEKRIAKELKAQQREVIKNDPNSWENSVNDYLNRISSKGFITAQQNADISAKEVQVAKWLADAGHDVEFLKAANTPASHTPDILLDGEPWEIKRIRSGNPSKVFKKGWEASAQSRNVILDLSLRTVQLEDAKDKARELMSTKLFRYLSKKEKRLGVGQGTAEIRIDKVMLMVEGEIQILE